MPVLSALLGKQLSFPSEKKKKKPYITFHTAWPVETSCAGAPERIVERKCDSTPQIVTREELVHGKLSVIPELSWISCWDNKR